MRTYAVRYTYPNTVDLLAYESKAVDSGLITLPMIAGKRSTILMVSNHKKCCLDFIKRNYGSAVGWTIRDLADMAYDINFYGKRWKEYIRKENK